MDVYRILELVYRDPYSWPLFFLILPQYLFRVSGISKSVLVQAVFVNFALKYHDELCVMGKKNRLSSKKKGEDAQELGV